MKCADEFRNIDIAQPLIKELNASIKGIDEVRIMEVCGTHTMSIFKHGIRSVLPPQISLLSGPGCPVCVTPASHIDAFIEAATRQDVIVATFGDLIRVPGSNGSLASARAAGAAVEIVYSPIDALTLAAKHPDKNIIFPAIGFETTAPTIAATVLQAEKQEITNFFIICAAKTMPGPLSLLMSDPELKIDGLLCPGHVSAIIGVNAYQPLSQKYNLHCAVAGFEPADILAGLVSLIHQFRDQEPKVDNCYTRAVTDQGNLRAQELIDTVFEPVDTEWRGLGMIEQSGLALKEKYSKYDALKQLNIEVSRKTKPSGCKCGDILKGLILPPDCPLYKKKCTPLNPVGPCMVSGEGTCAAYYKYSD